MAGDLARALLTAESPIVLEVIRDYRLPGWVNNEAFLLASSYSGDTEETLAVFDEALLRGVPTWVVTSGGELARRAHAAGCPVFDLPPGRPPRAALGHSLPPVLLAAALMSGLDPAPVADSLEAACPRLDQWGACWDGDEAAHGRGRLWRRSGAGPANLARDIAGRIAGGIPVLYAGVGLYEPAAVRWRAQLAENAKMLASHHVLPEMDHNEIVGWQENRDLLARCHAVFLTGSHDHPRVARRIAITAELIRPAAAGVETVRPPVGSRLEELLALVLLGDHVSVHAATVHGVDPIPVQRIAHLKAALREGGPA
ncbi:MAG: bifunctional phosphoglucose/phosphomannose isomerase [Gemmatimonadetes bacterium]|nr:bifunctional phosphoglucose/phosphomannose isomerase [Gemmatimonadota bacterium]